MISWKIPSPLSVSPLSKLKNISAIDFFYNVPEIYLALIIFVGLILVGTANFIPAANRVEEKKEVTLTLYEFARLSLLIAVLLYLFQLLFFLKSPAILFNGYMIVDSYTQTLKITILLTT